MPPVPGHEGAYYVSTLRTDEGTSTEKMLLRELTQAGRLDVVVGGVFDEEEGSITPVNLYLPHGANVASVMGRVASEFGRAAVFCTDRQVRTVLGLDHDSGQQN